MNFLPSLMSFNSMPSNSVNLRSSSMLLCFATSSFCFRLLIAISRLARSLLRPPFSWTNVLTRFSRSAISAFAFSSSSRSLLRAAFSWTNVLTRFSRSALSVFAFSSSWFKLMDFISAFVSFCVRLLISFFALSSLKRRLASGNLDL